MPQRRDQILDELHHTAEKIGIVRATPEEGIIDQFKILKRQILSNFPKEGGLVDPNSFRNSVAAKIAQLQQIYQTTETVFPSLEVPFERIEISPRGTYYAVWFVRPDHELLRSYPDLNFPRRVEQGVTLQDSDLRIIVLNSQQQLTLRPLNNIITPVAPDEVKLAVGIARWALDPHHI